MDIETKNVDDATIVALNGEINSATAPQVQQQILPLAKSGAKILLDMTNVPYTSSAGLRVLLSTHRLLVTSGGKIVLVGVTEDIQDTMSVTGFLNFFTLCDTVDAGLVALKS